MNVRELQLRRAHRVGDITRMLELTYPMCSRLAKDYYLPGGDRQDVLQEARLGVVTAIETWQPDGGASLRTFVELVARRRVQDAVTAATRHRAAVLSRSRRFSEPVGKPDDDELLLGETLEAASSDPSVRVQHRDDLAAVLRTIATLTPLERDAVVGIGLRGETHLEVAERRGTGPKAIDNAAQRARAKLRRELAA